MILLTLLLSAQAGDWPMWGGDPERNMVAPGRRAPDFHPGALISGTEEVDPSTTRGVRWVVKLGSQTYGNPTVADGRVFVGTNNAQHERPGIEGDRSLVQARSTEDGALLWQLSVPKLGTGKVNDWEFLGICSSPTVAGEVVYVVTNRGEVVALDVNGLANGNQGYQDEGAYLAGPGNPPVPLHDLDADILWRYDFIEELGVFPHNITSSSVLVVGDHLWVTTSNGVDWSHLDIPSPFAPTLVVLNRHTGELVAEDMSGISERLLHASWSSPTWLPARRGVPEQVIFGGGDGWLYGFRPEPTKIDGLGALDERWRLDVNPPHYRERDGAPIRYATFDGPSEVIATPVSHRGTVYASIGQDPEHGPGVGRLVAVDPSGEGDVSQTHIRWAYEDIGRSLSTVAVHRRVVYATDYDGRVHALHPRTGKPFWVHPTHGHIWSSPLAIGRHLLVGNEDGVLTVLRTTRRAAIVEAEHRFPAPLHTTPVVADGVLYLATMTHLYAIEGE